MDEGRIRYLENALADIERMLGMFRSQQRTDPRTIEGLERQRLTIQEEIVKLKQPKQQPLSIFGILDGFDDEEIITLPSKPPSNQ